MHESYIDANKRVPRSCGRRHRGCQRAVYFPDEDCVRRVEIRLAGRDVSLSSVLAQFAELIDIATEEMDDKQRKLTIKHTIYL